MGIIPKIGANKRNFHEKFKQMWLKKQKVRIKALFFNDIIVILHQKY